MTCNPALPPRAWPTPCESGGVGAGHACDTTLVPPVVRRRPAIEDIGFLRVCHWFVKLFCCNKPAASQSRCPWNGSGSRRIDSGHGRSRRLGAKGGFLEHLGALRGCRGEFFNLVDQEAQGNLLRLTNESFESTAAIPRDAGQQQGGYGFLIVHATKVRWQGNREC